MTAMPWGLNAHPDDSPGVWGARAILNVGADNPIDLLPDRQSSGGDLFPVLMKLLNEAGGMKIAQARVYALLNNYIMSPREGQQFTLVDNDLMTMVANTNGSHGYLYLSAWLKPGAFDLERASWSGSSEPPEPGEVIDSKVWKEPVPLLTYINLHGHRFMVFLTGRKPSGLGSLRKWRKPVLPSERERTWASERDPSPLVSLHIPHLTIGLTVGHELR